MSKAIQFFKHLYVEQGALLLQQVCKFINSPTTQMGKMLQMAISWTQAFLGTAIFFLTNINHPLSPIGP